MALLATVTAAFVLMSVPLRAELPKNKLETLANDVEQSLGAEKPQIEARPVIPGGSSRTLITRLRGAIDRADLVQIQTVLEQLGGSLDSAPLRDRCAQAALEVRTLREAKEKELLAEITRAVKRATDAVRAATKSPDLDEILLELGKFRNMRQEQALSGPLNSALAEMEHVIRFVTFWQDYIAQSEGGDTKAAQETLRKMTEIPPNTLIPRSELLARRYGVIGPQPSPAPSSTPPQLVPLELKTPEDLLPAIEKMTALFNKPDHIRGEERSALQRFIASLTGLANAYHEFKAGLATKLEIVASVPSGPDKFAAVIAPVRAQIIKLVLPRYLGLPPTMTPKPDEGIHEFLDRVGQDAVKKGDFLLAARARETQITLRDGKAPEVRENSQAALYVAAHNQEIAGQYALAVASYQKALATGSDLVPPKIIGDRLARIKAAHPKEFETGMETFLTPRMPPEFLKTFLGPGFPPHGPHGPQGPPGPRRPGPPQNAVLEVPPVKASPSPSASPPSASTPSKP